MNIPNKNSTYNNYNKESDFIRIQDIQEDKYIYISIESNSEETLETIAQIIRGEEEIKIQEIHHLQIYLGGEYR